MKVFSIGLNLDASITELKEFFKDNAELLCSVYFSLPLGRAYYTRKGLIEEYNNSDDKLIRVIDIIKNAGIRTEIALNTHLNENQLNAAVDFIVDKKIEPDEIACQNSSFPILHSAFPETEFISCYNNGTEDIISEFDSIVLGQRYLRDLKKRQEWINKGYSIILLLNNGCSFLCNPRFCNSEHCKKMYEISRKKMTASQVYALQSFFPQELRALAITDPNFFNYRFKLSTRPLGLRYTKNVLKAYATMISSNEDFFNTQTENYLLFAALNMLARNFGEIDCKEVLDYKKNLSPLKYY